MDERPGKCTSRRLARILSGPKSQFICGLLSVIGKQVWGPRSASPKTLGLPSGKVKKASGVLTAVYANDGTIGDAKSSVSSLTVKATQKSQRRAVKLWFIGWSRRWKARDLHLTFNNGET